MELSLRCGSKTPEEIFGKDSFSHICNGVMLYYSVRMEQLNWVFKSRKTAKEEVLRENKDGGVKSGRKPVVISSVSS